MSADSFNEINFFTLFAFPDIVVGKCICLTLLYRKIKQHRLETTSFHTHGQQDTRKILIFDKLPRIRDTSLPDHVSDHITARYGYQS